MKKMLSLLFAFVLAVVCLTGAFAENGSVKFDISVIKENQYAEITEDSDDPTVAFVEASDSYLTFTDDSFTHAHESQSRYSWIEYDLLIDEYNTEDPYPIWRLWILPVTEGQFYNFESVTLTIGEKEFTFSDIAEEEWYYDLEDGDYAQQLMIEFGPENLEFITAMEQLITSLDTVDNIRFSKTPIVLHGTEDVSGEINSGFLLEFMLFRSLYIDSHGLDLIERVDYSTPMTVK